MREELGAVKQRVQGGRLAGVPVRIGRLGETAPRAARALRRLLAAGLGDVRAVLVVGVAGGLGELAPCDLVVADRVTDTEGEAPPPDPGWLDALPSDLGRRGTLVSAARVAAGAAEKQGLGARHGPEARAVDLETAALARVAAEHGLPYLVLRAISDTADETMAPFLQGCFRADGSMSRLRALLAANVRPDRWRLLAAIRRRMKRCADVLAHAAEVAVRLAPA
jgi:adenosylhomocysteine nucleosidase